MTQDDGAIVFDVQRFSVHDGPGIRTIVFFKGCALACAWCQNPEAIRAAPEIYYDDERCLAGCARCIDRCRDGALGDRRPKRVDFARCTACGACVDDCPAGALRIVGRTWSARELLTEVLRDRPFYASSGGGITLSGGEPVLHAEFLTRWLPLVKREGLHVVLETCGAYPFALLEPLLEWVDLVFFDVKAADAERHRTLTGKTNDQITQTLALLLRRGAAVEVRMPVVPGRNDDAENVAQTAKMLGRMGVGRVTLLPYNHLWEAKLPRLGTQQRPLGIRPPPGGHYEELVRAFAGHGIAAST
ncbi:MAG: glycyl-radical enzyme activating protein [Deltaproteobacteria bacterium]|nr:glycyl-radical enzyme activating protein [Deltaproteobacteria bacterium]